MRALHDVLMDQHKAIQSHRERLGIGEYKPINGTVVLYNVTVETRDTETGEPLTIAANAVHIERSQVVIWYGPVIDGRRAFIVRRLGAPGLRIDGK